MKKHKDKIYFLIFIIIIAQIIDKVPIGGKLFMSSDNTASQSFMNFNRNAYDKGIVPQWNPYIFGGMPWSFSPHPIMMVAVLMNLSRETRKQVMKLELIILFSIACSLMIEIEKEIKLETTKKKYEEENDTSNKVCLWLLITLIPILILSYQF